MDRRILDEAPVAGIAKEANQPSLRRFARLQSIKVRPADVRTLSSVIEESPSPTKDNWSMKENVPSLGASTVQQRNITVIPVCDGSTTGSCASRTTDYGSVGRSKPVTSGRLALVKSDSFGNRRNNNNNIENEPGAYSPVGLRRHTLARRPLTAVFDVEELESKSSTRRQSSTDDISCCCCCSKGKTKPKPSKVGQHNCK